MAFFEIKVKHGKNILIFFWSESLFQSRLTSGILILLIWIGPIFLSVRAQFYDRKKASDLFKFIEDNTFSQYNNHIPIVGKSVLNLVSSNVYLEIGLKILRIVQVSDLYFGAR